MWILRGCEARKNFDVKMVALVLMKRSLQPGRKIEMNDIDRKSRMAIWIRYKGKSIFFYLNTSIKVDRNVKYDFTMYNLYCIMSLKYNYRGEIDGTHHFLEQ